MANTLKIELIVDDKGTVTMKNFGAAAKKSFGDAEVAGKSLSQSMGGVDSALKKIAAAVISYKAAEFAKDTALLAARYETLGVVMGVVGKNAGYSGERMEGFSAALQKTGISMIEARQGITKMAQAQLNLSQSTDLARVAQDAAVIGQINSSEAFNRMIVGIQTGQVEILRTIGINVNFEESYRRVAKETGRATDSFGEAEKAQIRMSAVLEAGGAIAGTYEAAMTTAGKKLSSFTRYTEDFKVKMGEAFGPATIVLVDAATETMKRLQVEIQKPEAQKALKDMSAEIANIAVGLGTNLPGALVKTTNALSGLTSVYNSLPGDVVGAAGVGIVGRMLFGSWGPAKALAMIALVNAGLEKMPGNPSLGGITQSYQSGSGAMQNIIDVIAGRKDWNTGRDVNYVDVNAVAADTLKNMDLPSVGPSVANLSKLKADKAIYDARIKPSTAVDAAGLKKLADEDRKGLLAGIQAQMDADDELYRSIAENREKDLVHAEALRQDDIKNLLAGVQAQMDADEEYYLSIAKNQDEAEAAKSTRLRSERDMYEDMRGFEADYYTTTGLMIDRQATEYKKLGIDEVAIAKWTEGEKQKALTAYVDKAGTLYQRLTERTRKYKEDTGDIHKGMFNTLDAGFKNLEGQISDNFFNVLTGNFQRVSLDWDSMWASMARSASNYAAQIAVTAAVDYTGKAVGKLASTGLDWLVDYFLGYGEGAWEVKKDKITSVHAGEMIIPADEAARIRAESGPSPGESWAMSVPSLDLSPEMEHAINAAAQNFAGSYGRGMLGKGLAGLVLTGKMVNPVLGLPTTIIDIAKAVMAGFDAYAEFTGRADAMTNETLAAWAGRDLGEMFGAFSNQLGFAGFSVDPGLATYSDMLSGSGYGGFDSANEGINGPGEGDDGPGWLEGGISRGPRSGHRETLHGDEAVVPLPNGRSIPVELGDSDRIIHTHVYLDGREIALAIADETERNDRLNSALKRAVS